MAILGVIQAYVITPTFPQFFFTSLFSILTFAAILYSDHFTIPYGLYDLEYRIRGIDPSQRRSLLAQRVITFRPVWLLLYALILAVQLTLWYWLLRECWNLVVVGWELGSQSKMMIEYINIGTTLTIVLILSVIIVISGGILVAITGSGIWVLLGLSSKVNAGKKGDEDGNGGEKIKKS